MKINLRELKTPDILFVGLQFLLFLLYFITPFPSEWQLSAWLRLPALILSLVGILLSAIAILQLRKNLSPFPSPVSSGTLVESGIFKKIRHPIYSGLIIFFSSYAIYEESPAKLLLSFILVILFYFKSIYEEKLLMKKFPAYCSYKRTSYRFFPFF